MVTFLYFLVISKGELVMQTEVICIIEGGLTGDKSRVVNYARTLAANLEKDGDKRFARRINSVLANKKFSVASLDGFSSKPVDQESRMDIVDVEEVLPDDDFVFSPFLQEETDEFVALHDQREKLLQAGMEPQNRLLLYGPPGCGKTSLARYIAAETSLPLVTARLDGLVSSLLGSTAKNIRKIFDYAARQECVLFLDEFDVVAKRRDDENELGELKRVVNSLIQNVDAFPLGSILIAATNHHELLDPAVWRRFNKVIEVPLPTQREIALYVERFVRPRMTEKLTKRYLTAFAGLSYSDLSTVANNAYARAIINGREGISNFDMVHETYMLRNHGIGDENEYLRYLISSGCTQQAIVDNTNIPRRTIQQVPKQIRSEVK